MRKFLVAMVLVLATWSVPAFASPVWSWYLGGNGIWWQETAYPSDFEVGPSASVSLSPHISLVADGFYGFGHSYVRGSGGFRLTASDPNNDNFSVGLGGAYHVSSETAIHPQEFRFDAGIGFRPLPIEQPKLTLIARGFYGLESNAASVIAGARYLIGGSK